LYHLVILPGIGGRATAAAPFTSATLHCTTTDDY
jgi:hypothetical protein